MGCWASNPLAAKRDIHILTQKFLDKVKASVIITEEAVGTKSKDHNSGKT